MNIYDFQKMKIEKRKITMTTCYDYWTAAIIDQSDVDCVLVGDSLAMVMHGHATTLSADTELMALHVAAVARGLKKKFLIGDLPFLSYRAGIPEALANVGKIMRAGAHCVKLEGVWGHEDVIAQIIGSGVPVMGHIGLTPQSFHQMGGYRVQGRGDAAADLIRQAKTLESLGVFALVIECVPHDVTAEITAALSIPTIGIGAGIQADGQVLVIQDLLGMNLGHEPKFLRKYMDGKTALIQALNSFQKDVLEGAFPSKSETYY